MNTSDNLAALKVAVSAVIQADKSWLQALKRFLEGPHANDEDAIEAIKGGLPHTLLPNQHITPNQAISLALDEVTLLQLADRKLEGKITQLDPTPENLSIAIVESEAYLVITDDAFNALCKICDKGLEHIQGSGITSDLRTNANTNRNTTLAKQISDLRRKTDIPPFEPDGTELLLGKNLSAGADEFLALMVQAGVKATITQQTQKLLSGGRLTLSDKQINALTNGWGQAVQQAAQNLTSQSSFTIADLFSVHATLETLYDRLETNVTRSDIDIISLEI